MTLAEFVRLSPEHSIDVEAGRVLQLDICTKGIAAVPDEHRRWLHDYLERLLLHDEAELSLRDKLEAICDALSDHSVK